MTAIFRDMLADGVACLRFFSRLPLPGGSTDALRPFGTAIRMLPLAGLVIGACAAAPLWAGTAAGLPHPMAATLGVAAGLLATGGLHEDGLADMADGLGGGTSPERKLAIMRDSRIGSYGVLALVVALAWRAAALTALLDRLAAPRVAILVLGAAAVSRAFALLPMAVLAPARPDGLGRGVGRLDRGALALCIGVATLAGIALPPLAGVALAHGILACGLALLGAAAVTRLAWRQIGGHTGDIAGASQQVAEAGYFMGLLVFVGVA